MTTEILVPNGTNVSASPTAAHTPAMSNDMDRILTMLENPNLSPERLTQALDLFDRVQKTKARMAFSASMAKAKARIGPITKTGHVFYASKDAGKPATDFWHETLADIAKEIDPILGEFGLHYRWRVSNEINKPIVVTCIVEHELGHYEETTLCGPPDSSGNKNGHQAIASACSLLQRYTLRMGLGLSAQRKEDAGASADTTPSDFVTTDQAIEIDELIRKAGVNRQSFLDHFAIEVTTDLRAADFEPAKTQLNIAIRERAQRAQQARKG